MTCAILAVTEEQPRVLLVDTPEGLALPCGPLDPARDRTFELALRRWVREQTGLELGYVEQLYTFGNRDRDPREREGAPRQVAIAYLALVHEAPLGAGGAARWVDGYDLLPWEDWRRGRPAVLDGEIEPRLGAWSEGAANAEERAVRRERADIAFGRGGAAWDGERVLDRFELLFEVGLVEEAERFRGMGSAQARLGTGLALDHRRILASALGRLRGKLRYRPVVFELLPETFTLLQAQRVVEALAGVRLHKQNFRRLVEAGGLVEGTGERNLRTGGRPAELFRFRREVLRERPAPGVGLPGTRTHG
ncbi:MAG: hypothetical protein KDI68_04390 [Gammaproteobacteria bacterium]|nr:hypothetical protein [Gammaproteobacteria bacterium]